jgi:TetR/AcrR family acrAB operon transcriptional repressor
MEDDIGSRNPMRRTKEEAAETRRQILRSAEDEFLARGYENAKLEDIANAVGVTRGAVHWHFKNKQGLLYALRDDAKRPFMELAERLAEEDTGQPLDALGDVICGVFTRLSTDPRQRGMLQVMFRLDATPVSGPSADPFRQALLDAMTKVLEIAEQRQGLPAPWTAKAASAAMRGIIEGLLLEWSRGELEFELLPYGQAVVRTILTSWKI